jgi:hypothetical protein
MNNFIYLETGIDAIDHLSVNVLPKKLTKNHEFHMFFGGNTIFLVVRGTGKTKTKVYTNLLRPGYIYNFDSNRVDEFVTYLETLKLVDQASIDKYRNVAQKRRSKELRKEALAEARQLASDWGYKLVKRK